MFLSYFFYVIFVDKKFHEVSVNEAIRNRKDLETTKLLLRNKFHQIFVNSHFDIFTSQILTEFMKSREKYSFISYGNASIAMIIYINIMLEILRSRRLQVIEVNNYWWMSIWDKVKYLMLSFCSFIIVINISNTSLSRDCVRYIRFLAKKLCSENCVRIRTDLT